MTDPNDSAYPTEIPSYDSAGLTKRELFAAMAMQGLLTGLDMNGLYVLSERARLAVDAADELIHELNK